MLPGYRDNVVLTSGAPMSWHNYTGGQREALIGGALFEGLAGTREDAISRFESGRIEVGACHDYSAVGSLAGIYTASMPVFVVENRAHGNRGFCNFYEGKEPRRLNYGCYDDGVRDRLMHVNTVLAPVVGEAIRRRGGIALKPLIARALRMGDEVHSRNAAASTLFNRELLPAVLDMVDDHVPGVRETMLHLAENDYFFLRLSMAAAKASADAMVVPGSTLVSAMAFSCRGFAIKLAGLGDTWFRRTSADSSGQVVRRTHRRRNHVDGWGIPITETIGLGGFAQACALPLQEYQGGAPEVMIERNREMYAITYGENSASNPAVRFPRHPDRYRRTQGPAHRRAAGDGRRPRRPRRRPDRCRRDPRATGVLRVRHG